MQLPTYSSVNKVCIILDDHIVNLNNCTTIQCIKKLISCDALVPDSIVNAEAIKEGRGFHWLGAFVYQLSDEAIWALSIYCGQR